MSLRVIEKLKRHKSDNFTSVNVSLHRMKSDVFRPSQKLVHEGFLKLDVVEFSF